MPLCESSRTFTLIGGGTLTVTCEREEGHPGVHVAYLATDVPVRRAVVEWKGR